MRVLKIVLAVLVLAFAGLLVAVAPALPLLSRWLAWPAAPGHPVTVLVAGVTPRYSGYHTKAPENFTGLTDTMILAQLNPKQKAIKLLSLPRDTQVDYGGGSVGKLNEALQRGGPEGFIQTVQALTGVKPDAYLLVSLNATRHLVDALGGIRVYVPEDMNYDDTAGNLHIHLKQGWQTLNGETAEQYLRFRHDARGDDISRVGRQQAFFRAVMDEVRKPATLLKLPAIARVIAEDTRTNVDRSQAGALLGFMLTRPRTDTLLLPGDFGYQWGVSYWISDPARIRQIVQANMTDAPPPAPRDAKTLSIAVVNVTTTNGLAAAARAKLVAAGFQNVTIFDAPAGDPTRTVVLSPVSLDEGRQVSAALGVGEARISGEGVPSTDLTIRVGNDFKPQ
ncbi:MAG TPA: LCP family protein [Deinococcales bacterium]|nr:LCP family protein [Deinococcales bacterium]